ncbi:ABC transporter permease [Dehalococcoidia bacterium]|nr:ABC transporter permease [Dehalococcoidia bacterium]MCL0059086.1 ABC transporter permease [Dehalococcoidia bacterium]MCL0064399.1 ABC transporter permease [Dehalococcoidia bacterium]MCL0070422.1 ABC transporter permease [Dehalococcoidia bacterium]MCL0072747.1 ABC transporter permease [Dehalococcoidia bacterium]
MTEIGQGFVKALELIISLDPEVMEIAWRSLRISAASTVLASLICIPIGGLIHFRSFRGKRILINIIQTFYSFPTVAIGLLVFLMISRAGPLGFLGILFTPAAMVVGQMVLITPILLGLTISALSGVDKAIKDTAISLGATEFQAIWAIIKEARYAVMAAVTMGFGRAISEVGCAMMVGGNIRGFTRIMTTAIALETVRGELELAIALGIILIGLALIINVVLNIIQQRYT